MRKIFLGKPEHRVCLMLMDLDKYLAGLSMGDQVRSY